MIQGREEIKKQNVQQYFYWRWNIAHAPQLFLFDHDFDCNSDKFEKNKTCSTTTTRCRWKLSGAQLGAWAKLFPEGVNFPHFWPGILDLNSDFDIFHNSKLDNTFLKYMQSYRHVNFWHPFRSMSKKEKFCTVFRNPKLDKTRLDVKFLKFDFKKYN